jgi:hypothetical protein
VVVSEESRIEAAQAYIDALVSHDGDAVASGHSSSASY